MDPAWRCSCRQPDRRLRQREAVAYCAWTTAYNSYSYPTLEACEANISGTDKGTCGPNPASAR